MKIGTNATPVAPSVITETPACKEDRKEENDVVPKMNTEAGENTMRLLFADAYAKKCQGSDVMCSDVPSDDTIEVDEGVENASHDMREQMDSEPAAEMPDSEEPLSDNNLSIVEENARANSEVIVGTGDRAWYLAMVAAGGMPVQDLRPNEVLEANPEDKKTVSGTKKL